MRTKSTTIIATLIALAGVILCHATAARANILSINTPVSSFADIVFNDTTSVPAGGTYGPATVTSWNGSPHIMPLTADANGDFAKAGVAASFVPLSPFYSVNLGGLRLHQASGNTGYADLTINFQVQYQLDGAGLPAQSTLYPILGVNGTVQPGGSGFAAISGTIDYYGTTQTTAGIFTGLLDTVTYNSTFSTPGTFSAFVGGTPTFGTTPALIPSTNLILNGSLRFRVDPADLNVDTVVPEPGTGVVLAGAMIGLATRSQLRRQRTAA